MKSDAILLGNLYGDHIHSGYAGNVWDIEGIIPALQTMQGGNRQPMILEILKDSIEENGGVVIDDTYGFEDDIRIYNGISPTLRAERQGLKVIVNE